jgi:hypothetical protein
MPWDYFICHGPMILIVIIVIQLQHNLLKTLPQIGQNQMLNSKHLLKIFHRAEITQLASCLA